MGRNGRDVETAKQTPEPVRSGRLARMLLAAMLLGSWPLTAFPTRTARADEFAPAPRPAHDDSWDRNYLQVQIALEKGDLDTAAQHLPATAADVTRFDASDKRIFQTEEILNQFKAMAVERETPQRIRPLLDATSAAIEASDGGEHPFAFNLLRHRIELAVSEKRLADAIVLAKERAERAKHVFGSKHSVWINARNDLALILMIDDHDIKARIVVNDTLREAEASLGPEDPALAPLLVSLARLQKTRRSPKEVLPTMERALTMFLAKDPSGQMTVRTLLETAALQIDAGDAVGAQIRLENLANTLEKAGGPGTTGLVFTLSELSRAQLGRGDVAAAERTAKRALSIAHGLPEGNRSQLLAPLKQLGVLYSAMRRDEAARSHYQQALEIVEAQHDPEASDRIQIRLQLAPIEARLGNQIAAEALLLQARRLSNQYHGKESLLTGSVLNSLAYFYAKRQKFRAAEPLAKRARRLITQNASTKTVAYASVLGTLALIKAGTGKIDEAKRLAESSLRTLESAGSADTPQNIEMLENYRSILTQAGDEAAVAQIERRIAAITATTTVSLGSGQGGLSTTEDTQFNFRFRPPSPGWIRWDPSRVSKDAKLAYARTQPPTFFALLPQLIPPNQTFSSQHLISTLGTLLAKTTPGTPPPRAESVSVGKLRGHRIQLIATMSGKLYRYVAWITVQRGVAYQLLLWAPEAATSALEARRYSEEVFAGFSLLEG